MDVQSSEATRITQMQGQLKFVRLHSISEASFIFVGIVLIIMGIIFAIFEKSGEWTIFVPAVLSIFLGFSIFYFRKRPMKHTLILILLLALILFVLQTVANVYYVLKCHELFQNYIRSFKKYKIYEVKDTLMFILYCLIAKA